MRNRLFVVSNRLPLSIKQKNNSYVLRQSSGGLISAINTYLKADNQSSFTQTFWVGIPDCSKKIWESAIDKLENKNYDYLPIFVEEEKYELYYNGFANSLVWPLFHYFASFANYDQTHFDAYMEINEMFADALLPQLRYGDVVWIHDYHLMPLAGILRKKKPSLTIGFFLHIPFPSYELFRVIPKQWQHAILTGMLGADLIGFHTLDYASHFLFCLETILKIEANGQNVAWENRQIKIDAFPVSIDFDLFFNSYDKPEIAAIRKQYLDLKKDKKLIFSVDRLDYTKGIYKRLTGYEQFLLDNPDYKEKVIFVLNIVPSRDSISKYIESKQMIDEYIGDINSRLGNIGWQPVLYQYAHLKFEQLIALYTACDMALITPIRDGMNLVAKEFVASRKDKLGVLILSEMTGAAKELSEALLINPNDNKEIATMIKYGLEMKPEEQSQRITTMQNRIKKYDVNAWATDFFTQLNSIKDLQLKFEVKFLDNISKANLLSSYVDASQRLLLLDYDGTLTPFSEQPSEAVPSEELLQILEQLSRDPQNDVYIISGRDGETLERWLGHLPSLGLIAEHGAKIRTGNNGWRATSGLTSATEWMHKVEDIMDKYVAKCPRSFIEKKEFSIAWHYRNVEIALGQVRAKELQAELQQTVAALPLNVLMGNKVIEVKFKGNNKGSAAEKIIKSKKYDFILSVGDDRTDEDMFLKVAKLPQAFSIKVGSEASFAKYNLHTSYMVLSLLHALAMYNQNALIKRI
ncbi:hypothetical protein A9P82_05445 [Arachidicoccus ginsenosidimutans]|uniref:bifunctional alpha,alpha-trehalose-phosphate synthase (UDP-forming)/trehalose-phosphatase n=1 Tax=Arachidicoccus sp. BS20 TaxID=1850526 RepID=UPI0007F17797|nr:bifunctional alpha,alpha-trehalose-phosphate synthase (UDP-forming)/trehalose-phosphatase [Arachidicoccus sp. BS20]ANI88780.1 hypothetical protein A9P82_05445 [Arachidicoccus sp. BS20]